MCYNLSKLALGRHFPQGIARFPANADHLCIQRCCAVDKDGLPGQGDKLAHVCMFRFVDVHNIKMFKNADNGF